jgi:S-adenosyl methyltransferase
VTDLTRDTERANRAFLGRAVRYLAGAAGIRQFLDIGAGRPAAENTHQIAQAVAPAARVVYADHDPSVLAQANALLASGPAGASAYVDADARDPARILTAAAGILDFSRPVAVLMLLVLQYVPDGDDPHKVVTEIMNAVPAGSYLVISDTTSDIETGPATAHTARTAEPDPARSTPRPRAEILRYFAGLDLIEPGLVPLPQWRNPGSDLVIPVYAGAARKS